MPVDPLGTTSPIRHSREIAIKLDAPSNWSVSIIRQPTGEITVGVLWGDKETMTQWVDLDPSDFLAALAQLGLKGEWLP